MSRLNAVIVLVKLFVIWAELIIIWVEFIYIGVELDNRWVELLNIWAELYIYKFSLLTYGCMGRLIKMGAEPINLWTK